MARRAEKKITHALIAGPFYDMMVSFQRKEATCLKRCLIEKNDAGQRLDKFLTKRFPNLPQSLMYKSIRTKNIKVNRKRAEISTRLNAGDVVDVYASDAFLEPAPTHYDFLAASKQLDILFEDENVLLLNKKVGLLSHPDDREYVDTLITRVKRYLYDKGEYRPQDEGAFTPALVNRIDRNTSGIVIAAKNAEALRILNQKLKDREISKRYLCVVHGVMPQEHALLEGWLEKDEAKNKVTIYRSKPSPAAKEIRTAYRVLKTNGKLSLLEIELLTGRTHQIRAHLASVGHPLLGDGKYGTNALNKQSGLKKQCLCSYRLEFRFTADAGILNALNGRVFTVDDVWFARDFDALAAELS